ncbi:unnamed protein product [Symbiodinium sp. CCMP2592]|nr:unnamed protein product [Symbiodinium sp. CCMP2592]
MALMSVVDYHECVWPPKLELTGMQAVQFMKAPVWLCTGFPTLALVPLLAGACSKYGFSLKDRTSLMWWHVNLFWFHTGCDVFSGYYQVMPVLTELYTRMSPTHSYPRWHPNRVHFDCAYALELFVEAPFAAWMMYLFLTQDHRRYLVELVALAIQFAGTVVYYIPGIMRLEHACWLSWADKACGSVWMIFPAYVFWRTLTSYRNGDSKKHS